MSMSRGRALTYAMLALIFGGLSYAVGVGSLLGQRAEASVLEAASFTYDPPAPLSLVSIPAIAIALLVLGGIAFWAHGVARALAVVLIPAVGIVASQLLKQQVLERPGLFELDAENTFPSGHMTVFAVLGGALIWSMPRALQPLAALVATVGIGVSAWQLLEYGWHRPSDLVGGLALAVLVFALAALVRGRRSTPRVSSAFVTGSNRVLGIAITVAGITLLAGGLLLTAVAGWFASSQLMLSGAQVAMIGASALTARALLALNA